LAGERPDDWGEEVDFRPWPPSAEDREQIDHYSAAVADAFAEEAERQQYEVEREHWLETHAPEFAGDEAIHECFILIPDGNGNGVDFEELAPGGVICGARSKGTASVFGDPISVLVAVVGRESDDPWVLAVNAALARERAWPGFGRRETLEVRQAVGEMFHVSAVENRDSIRHHGLDWRRMGTTRGVAGSSVPELEAIFLCESRLEADFFTRMARTATDVWAANVDGLWLENGPSGWMIAVEPIPTERIELVDRDIRATRG